MRRNHLAAVLAGLAAVAVLAADASATYHPTLGRFLQRDPIGYADGMSLCEYAASTPVGALDPLGHRAEMQPGIGRNWREVKPAAPGRTKHETHTAEAPPCFGVMLRFQGQEYVPPADKPQPKTAKEVWWRADWWTISGAPRHCFCCDDGSIATYEFTQEITRQDQGVTEGNVKTNPRIRQGLDNSGKGGMLGGDPGQPPYRDNVTGPPDERADLTHTMVHGGHTHYWWSDGPYITSRFELPPGSGNWTDGKGVTSVMYFVLKALKICPDRPPEEKGSVDFAFRLKYDENRLGPEDWTLEVGGRDTAWRGGPTQPGVGLPPGTKLPDD